MTSTILPGCVYDFIHEANANELRELLCTTINAMDSEVDKWADRLLSEVSRKGINPTRAADNKTIADARQALEALDEGCETLPYVFWVYDLAAKAY